MVKIGFIGAGTVGTALAIGLSRKGYPVVAVSSRSQTSARNLAEVVGSRTALSNKQGVAEAAELIFITTPDDAIASVISEIKWHRGQSVVHCSGADSTDILASAKKSGAYVGVFHPLQTFASSQQAIENMPGTTFTLEAEKPLLDTLKVMAIALGGNWIVLRAEDRVTYHAAAVFACNYLVTLVKLAGDLWQTSGFSLEVSTQALLPLLKGTINNMATIGIPKCLTGPIARGDTGTVRKHLKAIKEAAPDLAATYRELGLKTIPIAVAKGSINREQAGRLEAILRQAAY